MSLSEQLISEYGIDAWPEEKRAAAYYQLVGMQGDIDRWPDLLDAIVGDTREALAALRDTKDVWL